MPFPPRTVSPLSPFELDLLIDASFGVILFEELTVLYKDILHQEMHSLNFTSITEVPEHVDLAIIARHGVIPGFFGIIKELSHEDLTRFCNIDSDREMAIIAEVRHGEKREEIVVGRLIMEPGRKHG